MSGNNYDAMFSNAAALHQAGRLDEAMPIYRSILAANPQHANALHALGLLHMQRGDWDEGIQISGRFLQIHPDRPDVLNNLGYAQQLLGRFEDARQSYERAIALDPKYANAYYNRGNLMHEVGRFDDARASFEKTIQLHPGHVGALINLGNALKELKRYEAALRSYNKAIPISPPRSDIHYNCGLVLLELKRYDEALENLNKAIFLAPDFADAHHSRGHALDAMKRYEEALESFDRAIALKPDYAEAFCKRGIVLQELKRYAEALASYDKAIQLDPDCADAYASRGHYFMEQGRMDEAEQGLKKAMELDPENIAVHFSMSKLRKYTEKDDQFRKLEALYGKRQNLNRDDQIALNFAIGKAREDVGKYDEAFDAYAEGNRLHYIGNPPAEKAAEELSSWVKSFFTNELFEKYAGVSASLPPLPHHDRTPIFIVGMPRSGTTLIEQILASHASLFGAGELNVMDDIVRKFQQIPHDDSDWKLSLNHFRSMGQEYMDRVWEMAPDAHYVTDKMPANYRYLGLIHLMLPNAKIIHAMRNPMDSCFSCYTQNFTEGHDYAYDLGALGRYYLQYMELMRHWHAVLPAGRILDVRYEDNVADPEREARRLLEYLGLPWDSACLKFYETKRPVSTASIAQVRRPIYSSSVARWKRFEKHLEPLLKIVGNQY